ncbi:hypothetical protein WJX74_005922 [Apatococcus lobatus]|uniref:Uncharacterized protein n=1 Tax=Apatococcus lobatus TaxID=904363 RepID=A0AAW1R1W2_9CHLO
MDLPRMVRTSMLAYGVICSLLPCVASGAAEQSSQALSFDHSGGKAWPHTLSGLIITSVLQPKHSKTLSAKASLTHCFPAQLHDGFYLIKSDAWLHSINATKAYELCGSDLLDRTQASIGILQVATSEAMVQSYASSLANVAIYAELHGYVALMRIFNPGELSDFPASTDRDPQISSGNLFAKVIAMREILSLPFSSGTAASLNSSANSTAQQLIRGQQSLLSRHTSGTMVAAGGQENSFDAHLPRRPRGRSLTGHFKISDLIKRSAAAIYPTLQHSEDKYEPDPATSSVTSTYDDQLYDIPMQMPREQRETLKLHNANVTARRHARQERERNLTSKSPVPSSMPSHVAIHHPTAPTGRSTSPPPPADTSNDPPATHRGLFSFLTGSRTSAFLSQPSSSAGPNARKSPVSNGKASTDNSSDDPSATHRGLFSFLAISRRSAPSAASTANATHASAVASPAARSNQSHAAIRELLSFLTQSTEAATSSLEASGQDPHAAWAKDKPVKRRRLLSLLPASSLFSLLHKRANPPFASDISPTDGSHELPMSLSDAAASNNLHPGEHNVGSGSLSEQQPLAYPQAMPSLLPLGLSRGSGNQYEQHNTLHVNPNLTMSVQDPVGSSPSSKYATSLVPTLLASSGSSSQLGSDQAFTANDEWTTDMSSARPDLQPLNAVLYLDLDAWIQINKHAHTPLEGFLPPDAHISLQASSDLCSCVFMARSSAWTQRFLSRWADLGKRGCCPEHPYDQLALHTTLLEHASPESGLRKHAAYCLPVPRAADVRSTGDLLPLDDQVAHPASSPDMTPNSRPQANHSESLIEPKFQSDRDNRTANSSDVTTASGTSTMPQSSMRQSREQVPRFTTLSPPVRHASGNANGQNGSMGLSGPQTGSTRHPEASSDNIPDRSALDWSPIGISQDQTQSLNSNAAEPRMTSSSTSFASLSQASTASELPKPSSRVSPFIETYLKDLKQLYHIFNSAMLQEGLNETAWNVSRRPQPHAFDSTPPVGHLMQPDQASSIAHHLQAAQASARSLASTAASLKAASAQMLATRDAGGLSAMPRRNMTASSNLPLQSTLKRAGGNANSSTEAGGLSAMPSLHLLGSSDSQNPSDSTHASQQSDEVSIAAPTSSFLDSEHGQNKTSAATADQSAVHLPVALPHPSTGGSMPAGIQCPETRISVGASSINAPCHGESTSLLAARLSSEHDRLMAWLIGGPDPDDSWSSEDANKDDALNSDGQHTGPAFERQIAWPGTTEPVPDDWPHDGSNGAEDFPSSQAPADSLSSMQPLFGDTERDGSNAPANAELRDTSTNPRYSHNIYASPQPPSEDLDISAQPSTAASGSDTETDMKLGSVKAAPKAMQSTSTAAAGAAASATRSASVEVPESHAASISQPAQSEESPVSMWQIPLRHVPILGASRGSFFRPHADRNMSLAVGRGGGVSLTHLADNYTWNTLGRLRPLAVGVDPHLLVGHALRGLLEHSSTAPGRKSIENPIPGRMLLSSRPHDAAAGSVAGHRQAHGKALTPTSRWAQQLWSQQQQAYQAQWNHQAPSLDRWPQHRPTLATPSEELSSASGAAGKAFSIQSADDKNDLSNTHHFTQDLEDQPSAPSAKSRRSLLEEELLAARTDRAEDQTTHESSVRPIIRGRSLLERSNLSETNKLKLSLQATRHNTVNPSDIANPEPSTQHLPQAAIENAGGQQHQVDSWCFANVIRRASSNANVAETLQTGQHFPSEIHFVAESRLQADVSSSQQSGNALGLQLWNCPAGEWEGCTDAPALVFHTSHWKWGLYREQLPLEVG